MDTIAAASLSRWEILLNRFRNFKITHSAKNSKWFFDKIGLLANFCWFRCVSKRKFVNIASENQRKCCFPISRFSAFCGREFFGAGFSRLFCKKAIFPLAILPIIRYSKEKYPADCIS